MPTLAIEIDKPRLRDFCRRWKDLKNVVVREYDAVDLDRIWRIIEAELPAVIAALAPLFPERPRP